MPETNRSLEDEPVDRLAALLRGSAGLVPFAGPILSELINTFIPNQRVERISNYLKELEVLIRDVQRDHLIDPQNVDLFEDGAFQAIRAISDQRIQLLARCVSEGIHAETEDKLNEKRVLFIISQLDEGDVLLLDAFDKRFSSPSHQSIRPDAPHIGASTDILIKSQLFDASIQKLERLSLLHFRTRMNEELKVPVFDRSGKPEGHRTVSSLGRKVLFRANLRLSGEP